MFIRSVMKPAIQESFFYADPGEDHHCHQHLGWPPHRANEDHARQSKQVVVGRVKTHQTNPLGQRNPYSS